MQTHTDTQTDNLVITEQRVNLKLQGLSFCFWYQYHASSDFKAFQSLKRFSLFSFKSRYNVPRHVYNYILYLFQSSSTSETAVIFIKSASCLAAFFATRTEDDFLKPRQDKMSQKEIYTKISCYEGPDNVI